LTGEQRFNKFLRENASGFMDEPYARYVATGDKQIVIDANETFARMLQKRKFEMVTSEVIMTDRSGLGFGVEWSPIGPMTGDVRGWGGVVPFYSVTWRGANRHFVALVTPEASTDRLKVLLYNFNPEPLDVEALLWRLDVGGEYKLTLGPDGDGDDMVDSIESAMAFKHEHRGDPVKVTVPSQKTMVMEITQTKKGHNNFIVPDLAMSAEDIKAKEGAIEVTVHNIGSKDSGSFNVALYDGNRTAGKLIGKKKVDNMKAPNDLRPKTITLSFPCNAETIKGRTVTAVADIEGTIYELTEVNNQVVATLD